MSKPDPASFQPTDFNDAEKDTITHSLKWLATTAGGHCAPSPADAIAIELVNVPNHNNLDVARKMLERMYAAGLIEGVIENTPHNMLYTQPTLGNPIKIGDNIEVAVGEKNRLIIQFTTSKSADEVVNLFKYASRQEKNMPASGQGH